MLIEAEGKEDMEERLREAMEEVKQSIGVEISLFAMALPRLPKPIKPTLIANSL